MTLRLLAGLGTFVVVSGCATALQQCVNSSTRDLRTVERLIGDTQTNLSRGYTYEFYEVTDTRWLICDYQQVGTDQAGKPVVRPRYCFDDVTRTERRPVAIDPAVEKRKLDGLIWKRVELLKAAQPAIAQCKAKYPE